MNMIMATIIALPSVSLVHSLSLVRPPSLCFSLSSHSLSLISLSFPHFFYFSFLLSLSSSLSLSIPYPSLSLCHPPLCPPLSLPPPSLPALSLACGSGPQRQSDHRGTSSLHSHPIQLITVQPGGRTCRQTAVISPRRGLISAKRYTTRRAPAKF